MIAEFDVEAFWKDVHRFFSANIRERSTTDIKSIAYAVANNDGFYCYYYYS